MAVHLPLSAEAQAEARILMLSTNNILKPSDGRPVTMPTQDMIIGLFFLTTEREGAHGRGLRPFSSPGRGDHGLRPGEITLQARINGSASTTSCRLERRSGCPRLGDR
jgi:DNA-directed RNA polymerase subunit beta'